MFSPRFSLLAAATLFTTTMTTFAAPMNLVFPGGRPLPAIYRRQRLSPDAVKQNGEDAQMANLLFATLEEGEVCDEDGAAACVDGAPALCNFGKWTTTGPCAGELRCYALPLVNSPGISTACNTQADTLARIQASGASGGIKGDVDEDTESETEDDMACEDDEPASTSLASNPPAPRSLRGRRFGRRQIEVFPITEAFPGPVTDAAPATSQAPAASETAPSTDPTEASPPSGASTDGSGDISTVSPEVGSDASVETVTVVSTVTIFTVAAPAPTEVVSVSEESPSPSDEVKDLSISSEPSNSSVSESAPSPEETITGTASIETASSSSLAVPTSSSLPIGEDAEPVDETSSASSDEADADAETTPVGGQITFSGFDVVPTTAPKIN